MPKRLLVNFSGIGDLVRMTPLLRQLAKERPVDLLCRPVGRDLLQSDPDIAAMHTLETAHTGLRGLPYASARRALGRKLARSGFDEVFLCQIERPAIRRWVESWAGDKVVAYEKFTDPDRRSPAFPCPYWTIEGKLTLEGLDPVPRIFLSEIDREAARQRLESLGDRVLVIQPGSSLTDRRFRRRPNLKGLEPRQWQGLLSRILVEGDADAVLIAGTAYERREARAIRALLPTALGTRVHDATGWLSMRELAAVLSVASAMISADTGPAHVAAAVGCPLLVFFGPSDPRVWAPAGRAPIEILLGSAPCQFCLGTKLYRTCGKNICLTEVPVETLWTHWRRLKTAASQVS
jgi:heptosyltransferase-2/heptosyltransferase-3